MDLDLWICGFLIIPLALLGAGMAAGALACAWLFALDLRDRWRRSGS